MGNLDIKKFITEIKARPDIWNCPNQKSSTKVQRAKAWEEINRIFCKGYDGKDTNEQKELARILQRKWRSLRDSYVREINLQAKEAKSGSPNSRRRKYIFYEKLRFLQPTVLKGNTSASLDENIDFQEEEEITDQEENENELQENEEELQENENELQETEFESVRVNCQPANIASKIYLEEELYDEDRLFLLSLLKDLKKVPEDNRLDAKTEIMLVLKKWRSPHNFPIFATDGPEKGYQVKHVKPSSSLRKQKIRKITSKQQPIPSPIPSEVSQDSAHSYVSESDIKYY